MNQTRLAVRLVERHGLSYAQATKVVVENDVDGGAKLMAKAASDDKKEQDDLEKKFKEDLKAAFEADDDDKDEAEDDDKDKKNESRRQPKRR